MASVAAKMEAVLKKMPEEIERGGNVDIGRTFGQLCLQLIVVHYRDIVRRYFSGNISFASKRQ